MLSSERCRVTEGALVMMLAACCVITSGCGDVDTLKREVFKKVESKLLKTKRPFTPRDGMTIRSCSLYQTANPNSEVIRKLPAETPVHLIDKVGEWYRVRTRDGREGYLDQKVVGGEDIIRKTNELRRSIEGMPAQAEGITKSKANFRLEPGRSHPVVEILPAGKKFEMYERVATLRNTPAPGEKPEASTPGRFIRQSGSAEEAATQGDLSDDSLKKDVWYKVRIEDGRVGYIYTHNLQFTPPEDIARMVPFMRLLAWKVVNTTDDHDLGAKNNYIVAYAPIGRDPGADYTRLYFMNWSNKLKRQQISWQLKVNGILPITNFHYEGKPGFSVRSLHPTKKNRLVLLNFVFAGGSVRKVSEEEVPTTSDIH
jgi:hypothetical protein